MKLKIGNTEIEIISNNTEAERKENLKNMYDVINNIADKKRAEGKNVDDWFYTAEELENLRKDSNYKFI